MPTPVDNVAASSVATSAWANDVADAINEINGDIYAAGQLAIPWAAVTGKPSTFPPAVHTHEDGSSGGTISYGALTDKPSTFPPAVHSLADHSPATPATINAWARGSSSGVSIHTGSTAPSSPAEGDVWIQG